MYVKMLNHGDRVPPCKCDIPYIKFASGNCRMISLKSAGVINSLHRDIWLFGKGMKRCQISIFPKASY